MRPRFSLRTLLVVTALVAAACWWLMAPTRVALDFKQAVESANYSAADAMFVESGGSLFDLFTRDADKALGPGPDRFALKLTILSRSWADFRRRERRFAIYVVPPENDSSGQTARARYEYAPVLIATLRGIKNAHMIERISRY